MLVLFLFLMIATSIQPQRELTALSYQTTSASTIRHNTTDNNNDQPTITKQGTKITTTTTATTTTRQSHSKMMTAFENNGTIENFQKAFCAIGTKPHSNVYVSEYVLPQSCEMPLGIAVDNDANKVWYVSTKKGVLGSYDLGKNKFDQEYAIPEWKSRENPLAYSQVWDVKVDRKASGGVWFTDEGGNAIWRYVKPSHAFEIYHIPGNSSSFGTTYPVSIEFDPKDDRTIYFVGTFSTSLWIGDITRMKNGTSDGISQIPIPINDKFKGIDPIHISTGSVAYDSKRNVVWISMLAYGTKGEIIKYNLKTRHFNIFDLPTEVNSPVGLVLDNSDNLWITNAGTSIFFKLDPDSGNIVEFVTSKASPRVYGSDGNNNLHHAPTLEKKHYNITTTIENISKVVYTLPYWLKKASDGSLWFNEQEGNKIARFDPDNMKLIEYWIPTQNRIWGNCASNYNSSGNDNTSGISQKEQHYPCGVANVLQFSLRNNKQIWFTEWSENKIGKIDTNERIPFSIEDTPRKELIIKRGETYEIGFKVRSTYATKDEKHVSLSNTSYSNGNIRMIVSGTFTSTGDLGNSTGSFDKEMSSSLLLPNEGRTKEGYFAFTPSIDLKTGEYTLMIGAEDDSVSYLKAIRIKIT
jgi:virginiamycin B lyase